MPSHKWSPQDLRQMKTLGIAPIEASRQLELFRNPPPFSNLDRPACVGDGLFRLTSAQIKTALQKYKAACRKGRFLKFVPASGAATRMFHLLMKFLKSDGVSAPGNKYPEFNDARELKQFREFMASLSRIAFFDELKATLYKRGHNLEELLKGGKNREILEALLLPDGLDYAQKPKGLIKFHSYSHGERTPLEEQLVEAAFTVRSGTKLCRIHFTVSEEHEEACREHFMEVQEKCEKRYGIKFEIRISTQKTGTNTLAVDEKNNPFRNREGQLVFRPSGHGSLLENLNALKGDLIYIKNIDNVFLEHHLEGTIHWKKILGGFLAEAQDKIFRALKEISKKKVTAHVLRKIGSFARRELCLDLGEDFDQLPVRSKIRVLKKSLDRPIRVCGMVPNRGEPGGGPFWVKRTDGRLSLQIVESAQVNLVDKVQKTLFDQATHFNPVDLVCAVRDWQGKPFRLKRFRDSRAVFISRKSFEGRELKALELPGLWNGSMADWITLFMEVPLETFNPVKTVFDLLKPTHSGKV